MNIDNPVFALNTLRAKWYMLLLAQVFGKKRVCFSDGFKITTYRFRGITYLTDYK